MFPSLLPRVSLALALLSTVAAAGVLTVGPVGSGAQFTQIQAAVNAAHEDDVLLVRAGTYQRVTVDKPLRILGVEPGVIIDGGTTTWQSSRAGSLLGGSSSSPA